jgi:hypothetical protein
MFRSDVIEGAPSYVQMADVGSMRYTIERVAEDRRSMVVDEGALLRLDWPRLVSLHVAALAPLA